MTSIGGRRPSSASRALADAANAIDARDVWLSLDGRPVLRGVDLRVDAGIRLGLLGPNGAGKTTLIRALSGVLRPERGTVAVFGRALATDPLEFRRSVGVVGHQSYLYPELTVRENLTFYARLYGVNDPTARMKELLEAVGLLDRGDEQVSTLSRGMIQRLALARAMMHDPPLLLLDEPGAGLDARGFTHLEGLLTGGHGGTAGARRTVVLTTHDLEHALRLCDQIAVIDHGRIVGWRPAGGLDPPGLREWYAELTPVVASGRGILPAGSGV